MRYLSEIPLTIERGVLCHNIVGHSVDMRPGLYGCVHGLRISHRAASSSAGVAGQVCHTTAHGLITNASRPKRSPGNFAGVFI